MQATTAPPVVEATRWIAVASLLGLIGVCVAWELWLAPLASGWMALKALPLCLPLPGLLKRRMYTYRWVSLLVWLYFLEGVMRVTGPRAADRWPAALEIALCVILFVACALHVRIRLRSTTA